MEVQMQEDHEHHMNMVMIKRRRTKRPRPSSPLALTIATSSCSTVEGTHGGGELDGHMANSSSSLSNSGIDVFYRNTDEEDMANCLILLAQGRNNQKLSPSHHTQMDIYQCKTCNRCFSSFQALGGHRASHKKPKLPTTQDDQKNSKPVEHAEKCSKLNDDHVTTLSLHTSSSNNNNNNNNSNNNNKNKNRVHECSICGAEFTSGQALGGHMRRHRPLPNSIAIASTSHELESSQGMKKPRSFLSLDLNLPAPEDDHRETKFSFASKEQVIVFSSSSLVDCHY